MIEIDGSLGEGGGQIVRTAVALSAVTGKPVRITRIRQGRSKPGLAAQHARAITALAVICDARTSGATPGSSEIVFTPGEIRGGRHRVEIGTAGSVTLLMQCLLPALLRADAPSSLHILGGTDVNWSPTVDYFKNVFLPALSSFGAKVSLDVLQRGYYPRGQGEVLGDPDGRLRSLPDGADQPIALAQDSARLNGHRDSTGYVAGLRCVEVRSDSSGIYRGFGDRGLDGNGGTGGCPVGLGARPYGLFHQLAPLFVRHHVVKMADFLVFRQPELQVDVLPPTPHSSC